MYEIEMEMRWKETVMKMAGKTIATLRRSASIGWEIPAKGDIITIGGRSYVVDCREYLPEDERWILHVN